VFSRLIGRDTGCIVTGMSNAVSDFIAKRGGPAEWAEKLQVKPVTIRAWRRRGIPRERWPDLIEMFPGTTLDDLKRVEAA
jgi:hypothetical protein